MKIVTALFVLLCGLQYWTLAATYIWGIIRLDVIMVSLMAAVSATVAVLTIRDGYGEA